MLELNQERFAQVVEAALSTVCNNRRWRNAIVRASIEAQVNPYIHLEETGTLILSPSNEIYKANGTCQCEAYHKGFACWHRALNRLLVLYKEM
jgi:hypothetical protein